MDETVYREIADLALAESGQLIPPTRSYLIEARLGAILRREGFSEVEELVACLKARPNARLSAETVAALTNKTTGFFSERTLLERVVSHVLPMMAPSATDNTLRIWCAGGSTGQEAYSLGILLEESTHEALKGINVEILTTDICEKSLSVARTGQFGHFDVQKGLSIHRLLENFTRLDTGAWQISGVIGGRVGVRPHNILKDAGGLGLFDVIFCRNVISDMGDAPRSQALLNLARQLTDSGMLILGKTESATGLISGLEPSRDLRGAYVRDVARNALTAAA